LQNTFNKEKQAANELLKLKKSYEAQRSMYSSKGMGAFVTDRPSIGKTIDQSPKNEEQQAGPKQE